MNRQVALKDVADHAGVSISAASKILNKARNPFTFSEETKKKVLDSAKLLGYKPNSFARAMLSGKTGNIGVIIEDYDSLRSINSFLLGELSKRAQKRKLNIILQSSMTAESEGSRVLEEFCVDGLILLDRQPAGFAAKIKETGLPHVFLNSSEEENSSIILDDRQGVYDAVRYLIGLGHKRIAYLNSNSRHYSSIRRLEGYRSAMKDAKLPYRREVYSENVEGALPLMEKLFAAPDMPSATVFYSDESALTALTWLASHNIKVPEQLSIIGINDSHYVRCSCPQISSVRIPVAELAEAALDMLSGIIKDGKTRPNIIFEETLIPRESTAPFSQNI